MSRFVSAAVTAFSLANLYLLFLTGPLVSPQHDLIFHLPGSATVLFVPVLLNLLGLWLVLTFLLWLAQRHRRFELVLWAALLSGIAPVMTGTVFAFIGKPLPGWLALVVDVLALASFSFVLIRPRTSAVLLARVRPLLASVFSSIALASLVLLGQLIWFGWQARGLNPPFVSQQDAHNPAIQTSSPHVLWIVLDELAFDQVYGQRDPGVQLPNFDRLASTATIFTRAVPVAEYTRVALPSLLTGLSINRASPSADGRHLALHVHGKKHWQRFDPEDTIFADARRAGLSTGVAGWYEPYCRLLPTVLNRCFWTYSDAIPADMSPRRSVLANTLQPLRAVFLRLLHLVGQRPRTPDPGSLDVQRHKEDYQALLTAGDALLAQQQPGLTLLHMPVPHPWGFYDRRSGTFPDHRTSYLDNLALADLYLGHVRSLLEAEGAWNNTDLVIMGDHSWRTAFVWAHSGFWTEEDQRASHGGAFDDRPAMIVKLHGQTNSARLDAPFPAVRTRALLDALLLQELRTSGDLRGWVEAHR